MFLIGRSFTYLKPVEGRLFCKLTFQMQDKHEQIAYIDATIISDFVVQCSFNEQSFQNKAIKVFKSGPLVEFKLSLSVDRMEVTPNTKNIDPNMLTIRSVQPVNIEFTEPKSLTIAKLDQ